MEYRIAQACMRYPDFCEGVRALLVDKDLSPVWNPGSVEEVSSDTVEDHFAPLAGRELVLPNADSGLMGGRRRILHNIANLST